MRIIISLLAFALITVACNRNKVQSEHEHEEREGTVTLNEKQLRALDLKLGTFEMRTLTTVVRTNGQLEVPPSASADVTAVIGGNVKDILVFHGDRVNKGQALVVLEHPDYITIQQEFAEIAGNLEFLENEYTRQKSLFESNIGSEKNYQQARANYQVALAQYNGLKSRLELLNMDPEQVSKGTITRQIKIVSPINGYVNDVTIRLGTFVQPGDKLFMISNNTEIHADFMVYEKDIHLIHTGQKINFTVANRPGEELTATIFAIGKEFESNSRAVHLHARLDKNPGNLIPGMYVSGHIHSGSSLSPTLPEDAVVTDGAKSYIFIVDEHAEHDDHHDHGEHDEHEDHEGEEHGMTFRMIEVLTGQNDEGYLEVRVLDSIPDKAVIVLNAAYYLLADMKKEETEHVH